MEKINIAELLKNCPKGMELDCTMFVNPVKLNNVVDDDEFPITIEPTKGCFLTLTEYGTYAEIKEAKCVIFPKGKTTWEGFVPPCRFKDGDIVSTMNGIWIGIVKRPVSGACETYVTIYGDSLVYNENIYCFERLATEEEKQKLFQAIKDNGYKWNPYTKTLEKLQPYKEETMEISEEFFDKYCKKCGSQRCTAEGEWLEECKHYKKETMEELRIDFPEDYDYAGIENKQVIFTKIKPQYPKTYEESKAIITKYLEMDCNPNSELILSQIPVHEFCKLIVARNAYWKIAGEQMGLGEPWKPDWDNEDKRNYVITCQGNNIIKDVYFIKNTILAFPTEEIRDTFYENFKELIEQCKELL